MNLFKQKFLRVPHLSVFESILETSRNPFVDWIWIIILSVIIIVTLIFNSINLYQRVLSGDIQGNDVGNKTTVVTFNQKDLKLIIDKFNLKEKIQIQAKKGYSGPGNPSI